MRKIVLFGLLTVIAGCNAASAAGWENMYYDSRRTGGVKRSDAAFQADLKACGRQTGIAFNKRTHDLHMSGPDSPAFKSCMSGRGLTWQYSHPPVEQRARSQPSQRSSSQRYWGWEVRHNDPRDWATDNSITPPPPPDIPPIVEPISPPLSIYDPQVNPGVFEHRDDIQSNW